jgi:MFS family permease
MLKVLQQSWPLLMGVMLLMVGNGVQGSLLGIRGALEGFTTFELSVVMSSYFLGFLGGSQMAPGMIRRVGHVRVFSALGSLISAVLILYPLLLDVWAWSLMRVLIGFCFSGIYVTAESWLNNTASNENRGRALSAYMIVQMLGIIASQGLLALGDPTGFGLFIIPSVLVSLAFMPILLADTPAPTFTPSERMPFRSLFRTSPLGCVASRRNSARPASCPSPGASAEPKPISFEAKVHRPRTGRMPSVDQSVWPTCGRSKGHPFL